MAEPIGAARILSQAVLAFAVACGAGGPADVLEPGPATPPPPPPGSSLTYRFGAKFEPPDGRVVHGIGQWEVYNAKYYALLPADQQPAAELIFVDLGDTPRGWEPEKLAARMAAISSSGRIPSVDIALRGLQPTPAVLATLPDPLYGIDHEVANGTKYDARIMDVVGIMKGFRKPVMMRIGGEFSGWWNGYHPYEYPKAFRKIVSMFRQAGVNNVAFVWCFEPAAPDDFDAVAPAGSPNGILVPTWWTGFRSICLRRMTWAALLPATAGLPRPMAGRSGSSIWRWLRGSRW